jgi:ribosomal protein S18 acetylase RimI-like enzyme
MEPSIDLGVGAVTLRRYEAPRDAERLAEIVGRIWSGGGDALMEQRFGLIGNRPWGQWQAQSVLDYINAPACRAFVAQESGDVIGFCSYLLDEERRLGTVGYNGIAPEHQGRKLGSAMMRFVMERFHEAGMLYAAVIVADNAEHAPARRVYEKHGFENLLGLHYMVQKL